MINLKKWMAKVSDKLSGLRGLAVVADNYFGNNTTGQTHTYTLESTANYLLICGKVNGATGSGVYIVNGHTAKTCIDALVASPYVTVTSNGLTLSVKIDANYMRVSLIKVGG